MMAQRRHSAADAIPSLPLPPPPANGGAHIVGVLLEPTLEYVVAVLACVAAG